MSKALGASGRAFESLGLEPREGQLETCAEIVDAFAGRSNVFLDAPTGSGKSAIGVAVARALAELDPSAAKSVIISSTNALVKQYERDFGHRPGVVSLFGAERYPCTLRTEMSGKPFTADRCYKRSKFFYELDAGLVERNCGPCVFQDSRNRKTTDPTVLTNFSYYAVDRLYLETLGPETPTFRDRAVVVFDEAHLINDQFSSHCTVHFSRKRWEEFRRDIVSALDENSGIEAAFGSAFEVLFENVRRETIGPKNAEKFVGTLMKFYGAMYSLYLDRSRSSDHESDYDRAAEVADKYRRMLCKVEDYFKYGFECAVTCVPADEELSVKPVFAKGAFDFLRQKYNLYMSATMDSEFMMETLALDPKTCHTVRAPYRFHKSDKMVVMIPDAVRINFKTSKDPEVLDHMGKACNRILKDHDGESGILIATSFALCQAMVDRIKSGTHRIIKQRSGQPVDEAISMLKESSKDEPTLLISPSLFEGVDLSGDVSRFQIIVKAPYPSLADKRSSYILHKYPGAYERISVSKLVQALGRSTRYKGDRSTSYFLDKNLVKLFDSPSNAWKDQFEVVR